MKEPMPERWVWVKTISVSTRQSASVLGLVLVSRFCAKRKVSAPKTDSIRGEYITPRVDKTAGKRNNRQRWHRRHILGCSHGMPRRSVVNELELRSTNDRAGSLPLAPKNQLGK